MTVAPFGEWNVNVTSMWISNLFSWTMVLKQLLCWHSFNLKFIRQGAPPSFCPFSLYFFHFRCFNLVTAQNPMFVLGVPIRQKTEVSQQKFVQKHSHQHTFSWFQSVPGKSGHAELVCTDTFSSLVNIQPWVCPCYCWNAMAQWWLLVTPDRRCRAVLKESIDGFDLTKLGREFQSVTVLWKKENL